MDAVVISIVLIILLMAKKVDGIISNEKILKRINNWHLNVKNNMNIICTSPYKTVGKKILAKWLSLSFVIIAIINYLSIAILGNNSDSNILENETILYPTFFIIIVLIGLISGKKDYYILIFITLVAISITGYFFHHETSNLSQNISLFRKLTFWASFVFASILIITLPLLMVWIYKLIAYLFYVILKYYFKLCIYLNPQKPIKPLIFITEILIIFLIPIFHLIKTTPQ